MSKTPRYRADNYKTFSMDGLEPNARAHLLALFQNRYHRVSFNQLVWLGKDGRSRCKGFEQALAEWYRTLGLRFLWLG